MKFARTIVTLVGLFTLHSAHAANIPPTKAGMKSNSVSISGLSDKANELKTLLVTKASDESSKITIDTSGIQEFISNRAESLGWTAQQVAEAVNKLVEDAGKELQAKVPGLATDLASKVGTAIEEGVSKLDAKAKFQADYKYPLNTPEANEWSAGACNTEGQFTGVKLSVTGVMQFEAGVSVGGEVSVPFKLTLGINGSVDLDGYNPVRPTSGTGRSITIKATPKWKNNKGATVGGQALLGLTITVEAPGNGTLSDVETTLTI